MDTKQLNSIDKKFPFYGWLGIILVVIFWYLNWSLDGLRTHLLFFPLWFAYCLTIDALTYKHKGDSLLTRNPRAYVGLFLVSALGWWIFEFINLRTQNWSYLGKGLFSGLEYDFFATLSFSTVIPAVFGTAELVGTFDWVKWIPFGFKISISPRTLKGFAITGAIMFVLMMAWPQYFFPFVWLSIYFIVEPVNVWMGNRSLASDVAQGDWRSVIGLFVGVLICGFFWEFWNFYSYPKWIYHIPYVDFARIFEMPLLGYGGYLPFSLELFAIYHFVLGLANRKSLFQYVKIIPK